MLQITYKVGKSSKHKVEGISDQCLSKNSVIPSNKFPSNLPATEAHSNAKPTLVGPKTVSPCDFHKNPRVSIVKWQKFRVRATVSVFPNFPLCCVYAHYFSASHLFTLQMMSGLKDTRYNSSNYTSRDSSSETDSDEGRRRCFKSSSWSRWA
jgi:hypothetical protein